MNSTNVIIKPLVTEKSMASKRKNSYTFAVARYAKKETVKKAIEKQFGVHVVTIATNVVKGKTKRVGTRRAEVPVSEWKKATIVVKDGQKIDIFAVGE